MTDNRSYNFDSDQEEKAVKKSATVYRVAILLVLMLLIVFLIFSSGITARTTGQVGGDSDSSLSAGAAGCCRTGSQQEDGANTLAQAALAFYQDKGGDITGLLATVEDYGCHQEISLIRDGVQVKRYSFAGSELIDITP